MRELIDTSAGSVFLVMDGSMDGENGWARVDLDGLTGLMADIDHDVRSGDFSREFSDMRVWTLTGMGPVPVSVERRDRIKIKMVEITYRWTVPGQGKAGKREETEFYKITWEG